MNDLVLPNPDTSTFMTRGDQLVASAGRAIIDSPENENKGGDLLKMIKTLIKQTDDDRKAVTAPIMAGKKAIDDRYKAITTPLEAAAKELSKKMITYKQAVMAEQQRKADEERKQREEEALKTAEQAAAEGKQDVAEEEINRAVEADAQAEKRLQQQKTVRSDYGATTTMKDNWSAEVVSITDLCQAIINGEVPECAVLPNMPWLNRKAKEEKDEYHVAGTKAVNNPTLASR